MKIILAMICGRESAHIETCLRAFAPAFDGLSLVLALGNQELDDTESKAIEICNELGKTAVVSLYTNGRGAQQWPHVDDFGAARQAAFMQAVEAGADWIFWADADDVIDHGCDIAELRKLSASGEAQAYGFPYNVVGTGKRPIRERLFAASLFASGEARWNGTVHENVIGVKVLSKESPVWRHEPHASKGSSKDRNLRLLKHKLADASINAFYVHQEHAIKGEWADAKRWGDAALAMPGLPDSFAYEIALNNIKQGPRSVAEVWAARAFAMFPHCREALSMLALLRMEENRFADALIFAQRMQHLPPPPPELRPWCYDARWYGWATDDLIARLLRLIGKPTDGEAAERAMRGEKRARISLIHATRGRHNQALAARERWLNAAASPEQVETIWCVDSDDQDSVQTAKQFRHVVVAPGGGCVRAWNAGAEIAEGEIFVQLSDDWMPPPAWDRAIISELGDTSLPAVLAVSDGHRTDDLLCMSILTRARWEAQGRQMFCPEYRSVYSDNEYSHRAWRDGVVVDARSRLTFTHLHPAFGHGKIDKTYSESNSAERYAEGAALFRARNPDAPSLLT